MSFLLTSKSIFQRIFRYFEQEINLEKEHYQIPPLSCYHFNFRLLVATLYPTIILGDLILVEPRLAGLMHLVSFPSISGYVIYRRRLFFAWWSMYIIREGLLRKSHLYPDNILQTAFPAIQDNIESDICEGISIPTLEKILINSLIEYVPFCIDDQIYQYLWEESQDLLIWERRQISIFNWNRIW